MTFWDRWTSPWIRYRWVFGLCIEACVSFKWNVFLFLLELLLFKLSTSVSLMSACKYKHARPYSSVCFTSLSVVLETQPVRFMVRHCFCFIINTTSQMSRHGTQTKLFNVMVFLNMLRYHTVLCSWIFFFMQLSKYLKNERFSFYCFVFFSDRKS